MASRTLSGWRQRSARSARSTRSLPSWRTVRRWLIVAVILAVALIAGYMLWFRDSSFVAVEKVNVTGADLAPEVAGHLSAAATGLSTLHLDRSALDAAVADDPTVIALKIDTDFPHGLTIDVESRTPAGWLATDDGGALIAADGTVLDTGVDQPEGLPTIEADSSGLSDRAAGQALAAARVLGAVPGPLQPQVDNARVDDEHGVVVEVTGGIELRFGSPRGAEQKWHAASAVLADPTLTSATYIDLSLPSRPAVG